MKESGINDVGGDADIDVEDNLDCKQSKSAP